MRTELLALMLLASNSWAADMTAYGLEIGKPLALAECARLAIPAMPGYVPPYAPVTAPCLQPSAADSGTVTFPIRSPAAHAAGGDIGYRVAGGVLQLLIVPTAGAPAQDTVLRDLTAKYGAPTSSGRVRMANAAGGNVESIVTRWALGDLEVELVGVTGPFDSGRLLIGTPAGIAAQRSREEGGGRTRM